MSEPLVRQAAPFPVDVEAGRTYWWCACGRSKSQPFCDGSHKAGTVLPLKVIAEHNERLWFCGGKRSGDAPLCDRSPRKRVLAT